MKTITKNIGCICVAMVLFGAFSIASAGNHFIGFYVNGMNASKADAIEQWEMVVGATRGYDDPRVKDYKSYLMYSQTNGLIDDSTEIIGLAEKLDECYSARFSRERDPDTTESCNLHETLVYNFMILPGMGYNIQMVAYSRGNIIVQKAIEEAKKYGFIYFDESTVSSFAIGSPYPISYGRKFTMKEDRVIQFTSQFIPGSEGNVDSYHAQVIRQFLPEYEYLIGSKELNTAFFGEEYENGHSLLGAYYTDWGIGKLLQEEIATDYIRLK